MEEIDENAVIGTMGLGRFEHECYVVMKEAGCYTNDIWAMSLENLITFGLIKEEELEELVDRDDGMCQLEKVSKLVEDTVMWIIPDFCFMKPSNKKMDGRLDIVRALPWMLFKELRETLCKDDGCIIGKFDGRVEMFSACESDTGVDWITCHKDENGLGIRLRYVWDSTLEMNIGLFMMIKLSNQLVDLMRCSLNASSRYEGYGMEKVEELKKSFYLIQQFIKKGEVEDEDNEGKIVSFGIEKFMDGKSYIGRKRSKEEILSLGMMGVRGMREILLRERRWDEREANSKMLEWLLSPWGKDYSVYRVIKDEGWFVKIEQDEEDCKKFYYTETICFRELDKEEGFGKMIEVQPTEGGEKKDAANYIVCDAKKLVIVPKDKDVICRAIDSLKNAIKN